MSTKSAERQRKYRENRKTGKVDQRRLDLYVDDHTFAALDRLCKHHGKAKRAILADLIKKAEERVLKGIRVDSEEFDAYFD